MDATSAAALRRQLRDVVVERGYERRAEPFRLSSGGESHDYVDMRRAVARGDALGLAARAVTASLDEAGYDFDVIGGMTMGADPVAHAVALVTGKGWFSVRKAAKEHGTGRRTEGSVLAAGVRVVVFEDTVSTGRSLIEALDVVESTEAEIVACCTLLDRGAQLAGLLAERGLGDRYLPLLTYVDLGIDPI
jgi:orotate phosphoribosyltransferase